MSHLLQHSVRKRGAGLLYNSRGTNTRGRSSQSGRKREREKNSPQLFSDLFNLVVTQRLLSTAINSSANCHAFIIRSHGRKTLFLRAWNGTARISVTRPCALPTWLAAWSDCTLRTPVHTTHNYHIKSNQTMVRTPTGKPQTAGQLSSIIIKSEEKYFFFKLQRANKSGAKIQKPWDQSYRQKQTMVEQVKDKIFWKGKFWAQSERIIWSSQWFSTEYHASTSAANAP